MASASKHALLLELGRGGMGTVYLAVSRGVGDFTKLKVVKHLRAELAEHAHFLNAFLDEARLAARLNHPNVVQTNEVGFDGAHYFLEMEYLEGQSLETIAKGGSGLPLPLALFVLGEVLAGLHYAHELTDTDGTPLHVVHRDVSPHNVFITYDGVVKLLDFGIAKAADASRDTSTGIVKGKLTYMAPEQAGRRAVDRRADVFSLGVMMWQALTGRRLWEDLSEGQIFHKMEMGDVPKPSEVSGDVPPALEAICMKALARDPQDRFATAREFQRALEEHHPSGKAEQRELAELVRARFASRRDDVKRQIDAALKNESSMVELLPVLRQVSDRPGEGSVTKTVSPGTSHDSPTAKRAKAVRKRWPVAVLGVVALAALGGTSVFVMRDRRSTTSKAQASASIAIPQAECTTNAQCMAKHDGASFVCRKTDGRCVSLESPRCTVHAEKGDVENDATVWIGTMFPMTGSAATDFGLESVNAADLARRDFMTIARGVPSLTSGRAARPIGIIACDDEGDVDESARHLVEDVRVPAVVGFSASQEVIDLATTWFIPNGVLAMATQNRSSLITTIPHPAGVPRLVWRTTTSAAQSTAPVSALISEVLEPEILPLLAPGEPLRVAMLRGDNTMGLSVSDAFFERLRFNGKSALENGESYRELKYDDDLEADYHEIASALLKFKPHVIISAGFNGNMATTLLEPLEKGFRGPDALRPRYVIRAYMLGDDFFRFLGKSADRRRRFLGVNPPSTTVANAKLTMHYNDAFEPKVPFTASPGAVYDAMYVIAYALYALGDEAVTGPSLARAIGRLTPPGPPIDVGPAKIFDVFNHLRAGEKVDLDGAATRLDFDLATGDSPTDFAILCVGVDERGNANQAVESGVVWRAPTNKLEGLPLVCP